MANATEEEATHVLVVTEGMVKCLLDIAAAVNRAEDDTKLIDVIVDHSDARMNLRLACQSIMDVIGQDYVQPLF